MNDRSNKVFGGVMFVLFGCLFLARNFGYINLHDTIRTYWPVVLVLIGINIVWKSVKREI
jgi:hypothetical protein